MTCSCGQKMKVPDTYIGKIGTCPKCKKKLRISENNTRPIASGKGKGGKKTAHRENDRKKRIGEMLVDAGIVTPEQIKEALVVQKRDGGKTGEILVSLGYMDVKTFSDFLAKQPGIASIDISNYEISRDLLVVIPKEFAIEHEVIPIDKLGNLLTVGMACPLDTKTIEELENLTKLRIKALLCALEDIQAVIGRYYKSGEEALPEKPPGDSLKHLESTLKLENVGVLIREIGALPTLPDTVHRVQAAMEDPDVSIHDVVDIVQNDPPVAARILSVANSAAYGFPNRVDSVSLAATLLGLHETYLLVLSSAVVNTFEKSAQFDYRRFWHESMACAQLATVIAQNCGQGRNTGVFAAALLHDIGRVALWEAAPQRYAKVDSNLRNSDLIEAEQKALGIAHPEAGYELTSNWGLPAEITEPVRFHHTFQYAEKARELTAVVGAAATFTDMAFDKQFDEDTVARSCGEALAFLGLDFPTVASLTTKTIIETDDAVGFE